MTAIEKKTDVRKRQDRDEMTTQSMRNLNKTAVKVVINKSREMQDVVQASPSPEIARTMSFESSDENSTVRI